MNRFPFLLLAVLTAGIFLPGKMYGHGVEVYEAAGDERRNAGLVCFSYSTGEPMMYAKVKLYPPSSPETETLQSITDRNGFFSFVPDEDGAWRIDAEDGMGHKGTITVNTTAVNSELPKTGTGTIPRPLGILAGLSLVINIFSIWYIVAVFLRSRKKGAYAHQ
jgi:nickel transport protein